MTSLWISGLGPKARFRGGDLGDLAGRRAALELGFEPDPHERLGQLGPDDARAERHDLCVVRLAGPLGRIGVVHLCGIDARDLVGGDRHADAGAADEDRPLVLAAGDRLGHGERHVGIVGVLAGGGPVVGHIRARLAEHRYEPLLECQAGVVGTDRDGHATALTDSTTSRRPEMAVAARPTKTPSTPAASRPAISPGLTLPPYRIRRSPSRPAVRRRTSATTPATRSGSAAVSAPIAHTGS